MEDGKKGIAQKIVYDAFDLASEKLSVKPMDLFNQALENIKPLLETKSTPCWRCNIPSTNGNSSQKDVKHWLLDG